MNSYLKFIFTVIVVFATSYIALAEEIDLLGLTLDVKESGLDVDNVNISVEIYDAATGGNLIYNSSDGFASNVTNGKVDIMLGDADSGLELNLTYGTTYYMDIVINGSNIDFNSRGRQKFQAMIGNITQSRLNLTGTLSTHSLIPDANLSFDLGSAENYYRTAFIQTLTLANTLDSGNITDSYLFNTGDTASGDYNFDSNTFFIDSGNNRIGILTSTPANPLNVIGDGNFTGALYVGGVQITADSNVSGGGTTNYITKFLGTATLGNSQVYDDGTSVGIDTTSPQGKLEISNSTALSVPWLNITDGVNGIKFVIDNAGLVGIGRYPTGDAFEVVGAGLFTLNLTVLGAAYLGDLQADLINTTHIAADTILAGDIAAGAVATSEILDRTLLSDDLADSSINTTLIVDSTILAADIAKRTITLDELADSSVNTTIILDATILESDLSFAPLLRSDNVAFINATNTFSADQNFGVNATVEDSLITDLLMPQNESFIRIDNVTITKDLRVLGNSYLGSFTIENELRIGSNNLSSTYVGLGTLSPEYLLHLNITDANNNETVTPLILLEKSNLSGESGDGYGSGIVFRLSDDAAEVENVSMIAGILEDVSNGTERGALVFYTGYGDVNGIISNLSSAEAMRITAEGNVSITNNLAVKNALEIVGYGLFIGNLTVSGAAYLGDLQADLINTTHIAADTILAGDIAVGAVATSEILDTTILESDLSFAPLLRSDNVAFINATNTFSADQNFGVNATVEDSLLLDYIFYQNNTVVTIENLSINQDLFTAGNLSVSDSLLADFIYPQSTSNIALMGGNVGIGTTSPQGLLEISNSSALSVPWLNITDGSNGQKFIIDTSGNVGIGTTAPGLRTEIRGIQGAPATSGTTQTGIFRISSPTNTNVLDFGQYGASAYGLWIQGTQSDDLSVEWPIVLQPNGGNVGIGTTNPQNKLQVNVGTNQNLHIRSVSSNVQIAATNDAYSALTQLDFDATAFNFIDGNVGIGTTAPVNTLNVIGDINATGAIYKNGQTALDFVFDKYFDGKIKPQDATNAENYTFIQLDELESYLNQKRHLNRLPGSVIANPYEIGQVDELYLEKIEESHIYIIELNKKLKKLEAEIQELKEEVRNNPENKQ